MPKNFKRKFEKISKDGEKHINHNIEPVKDYSELSPIESEVSDWEDVDIKPFDVFDQDLIKKINENDEKIFTQIQTSSPQNTNDETQSQQIQINIKIDAKGSTKEQSGMTSEEYKMYLEKLRLKHKAQKQLQFNEKVHKVHLLSMLAHSYYLNLNVCNNPVFQGALLNMLQQQTQDIHRPNSIKINSSTVNSLKKNSRKKMRKVYQSDEIIVKPPSPQKSSTLTIYNTLTNTINLPQLAKWIQSQFPLPTKQQYASRNYLISHFNISNLESLPKNILSLLMICVYKKQNPDFLIPYLQLNVKLPLNLAKKGKFPKLKKVSANLKILPCYDTSLQAGYINILLVTLLRALGIPSRLVITFKPTNLRLKDGKDHDNFHKIKFKSPNSSKKNEKINKIPQKLQKPDDAVGYSSSISTQFTVKYWIEACIDGANLEISSNRKSGRKKSLDEKSYETREMKWETINCVSSDLGGQIKKFGVVKNSKIVSPEKVLKTIHERLKRPTTGKTATSSKNIRLTRQTKPTNKSELTNGSFSDNSKSQYFPSDSETEPENRYKKILPPQSSDEEHLPLALLKMAKKTPEERIASLNPVKPLVYVIGINEEGMLFDLTLKYSPDWHINGRKLRIGRHSESFEWWDQTLFNLNHSHAIRTHISKNRSTTLSNDATTNTNAHKASLTKKGTRRQVKKLDSAAKNKLEQVKLNKTEMTKVKKQQRKSIVKIEKEVGKEILETIQNRPLPISINAYKDHPLYVLKRHLLRNQAIYPDDAEPLGYCKGEPVFSRPLHLKILKPRINWLKDDARLIKAGEIGYKLVIKRPSFKELMMRRRLKQKGLALINSGAYSENVLEGADKESVKSNREKEELFGEWQTELYVPPPVVDGKIPRNTYGNVELFQMSMLPHGCAYLSGLPGLNKVAQKLGGLECVPAMRGWEFSGGHAFPIIDGWVIIQLDEQRLLDEYDRYQAQSEVAEMEKRRKGAINNWKRFLKALLIKQKVHNKYGGNAPNEYSDSKTFVGTSDAISEIKREEESDDESGITTAANHGSISSRRYIANTVLDLNSYNKDYA